MSVIHLPRKSGALAPSRAYGLNRSHPVVPTHAWRLMPDLATGSSVVEWTNKTNVDLASTLLGRGAHRNGTNSGTGFIDLPIGDGTSAMPNTGGYTIVTLIQALGQGSNFQSLADDDDNDTATRRLQWRLTRASPSVANAIVWRSDETLDVNISATTSAATITNDEFHVLALRVIDSGEVSQWGGGIKDATTGTMGGVANPIGDNGLLRVAARKVETWNPSSSVHLGIAIYDRPLEDAELQSLGTPAQFWNLFDWGYRRIFLPGAAAASGRIMSSLAYYGGLAGSGGIAGKGGGLAG